jgi:acid phosphatase family membrane protein YuiD
MVGSLSAQIGLIAFAVAVAGGLHAGNTAVTVLTRAMLMMVGAIFVGQMAAYAARLVLRDHLQRQKITIDREHGERSDAARPVA